MKLNNHSFLIKKSSDFQSNKQLQWLNTLTSIPMWWCRRYWYQSTTYWSGSFFFVRLSDPVWQTWFFAPPKLVQIFLENSLDSFLSLLSKSALTFVVAQFLDYEMTCQSCWVDVPKKKSCFFFRPCSFPRRMCVECT